MGDQGGVGAADRVGSVVVVVQADELA
jgi:hypothetical protein